MKKTYEKIVLILALITIVISTIDLTDNLNFSYASYLYIIDNIILLFFAIDYIVRFVKSDKKHVFMKQNIFDLLAIIPFNSLFSFFRIFRIFRVMRVAKLFKIFKLIRLASFLVKIKGFLRTNGFIYILFANVVTIFVGATAIYIAEKGTTVNSFSDAIWWSFVTSTTVGYGDISPSTSLGRIIAVMLMVVGIAFVGMLTATIATYFIKINKNLYY